MISQNFFPVHFIYAFFCVTFSDRFMQVSGGSSILGSRIKFDQVTQIFLKFHTKNNLELKEEGDVWAGLFLGWNPLPLNPPSSPELKKKQTGSVCHCKYLLLLNRRAHVKQRVTWSFWWYWKTHAMSCLMPNPRTFQPWSRRFWTWSEWSGWTQSFTRREKDWLGYWRRWVLKPESGHEWSWGREFSICTEHS